MRHDSLKVIHLQFVLIAMVTQASCVPRRLNHMALLDSLPIKDHYTGSTELCRTYCVLAYLTHSCFFFRNQRVTPKALTL